MAFDTQQITSKANRTRVAPGLPASTLNAAGQMHVAEPFAVPSVANPLTARMGKGINTTCDEGQTMIAHALRGEGFDASEDGTGRGTPLVFGWQNSASQGDSVSEHITPSLDKSKVPAVAFPPDLRNAGRDPEDTRQGSGCNTADGDPSPTLTKAFVPGVVAPNLTASNDPSRSPQSSEVTQQVAAVYEAAMRVRRLTPKECCRLQGFPDDYLDITYRGKPAADGPKYKALGNSMAVPVMAWIGQRIAMVDALTEAL